ncbi:hypothetical protein MSAN_00957100 [Mycena sanguinolenta]|uniref:Uncharacterized protein n=1 Tax=Mycena sanguinolenta TaxID=230812 RepID=A0A8H7D993_9AGAR|nr:hypothetical protein MSAN_00957100 [Mycena sanguinolenta]
MIGVAVPTLHLSSHPMQDSVPELTRLTESIGIDDALPAEDREDYERLSTHVSELYRSQIPAPRRLPYVSPRRQIAPPPAALSRISSSTNTRAAPVTRLLTQLSRTSTSARTRSATPPAVTRPRAFHSS